MLITAGILGVVGGVIKIGTTVAIARANANGDDIFGTIYGGAFFYDPLLASGIGLTAGGMARRGALDAYDEMYSGKKPSQRVNPALGWGLFGGGIGVWGVSRLAGLVCSNPQCLAAVWETGYYASLAGTVPGAVIAGYSSGYRRYNKRFGHLTPASVTPMAGRGVWGLSLAGQF